MNIVKFYDIKLEIGDKHSRHYISDEKEAEDKMDWAESQPGFVRAVKTLVTEEIIEIRGLTYG